MGRLQVYWRLCLQCLANMLNTKLFLDRYPYLLVLAGIIQIEPLVISLGGAWFFLFAMFLLKWVQKFSVVFLKIWAVSLFMIKISNWNIFTLMLTFSKLVQVWGSEMLQQVYFYWSFTLHLLNSVHQFSSILNFFQLIVKWLHQNT